MEIAFERLRRLLVTPTLLVTAIGWAVTGAAPASADIIYSGPQNIVLQGGTFPDNIFDIYIAGDPGAWDTLAIQIDPEGEDLGIVDPIVGISQVSLFLNSIPEVARFQYGDAFPTNPVFPVGEAEVFWGLGTNQTDGDFYAAMELDAAGANEEEGWIHLNISNLGTPSPKVVIEGWAYAINDVISSIGQVAAPSGSNGGGTPVPEIDPAAGMSALTLLSGTLLVIRGRRRQPRQSNHQ